MMLKMMLPFDLPSAPKMDDAKEEQTPEAKAEAEMARKQAEQEKKRAEQEKLDFYQKQRDAAKGERSKIREKYNLEPTPEPSDEDEDSDEEEEDMDFNPMEVDMSDPGAAAKKATAMAEKQAKEAMAKAAGACSLQ